MKKRNVIVWIIAILFFGGCLSEFASRRQQAETESLLDKLQPFRLHVRAVDAVSGLVLPNQTASIFAPSDPYYRLKRSQASANDGQIFTWIATGAVSVTISSEGYETNTFTVTVTDTDKTVPLIKRK